MSSLCELLHNMYKNIMDEVMNKIHFLNKNILRYAQNNVRDRALCYCTCTQYVRDRALCYCTRTQYIAGVDWSGSEADWHPPME